MKIRGQFVRRGLEQAGFTLVELLVVIAIISIMGSVSMLILGSQLPTMRLHSAVSSVQGAIATARIQAIRSNRPMFLVFDVANRRMDVIKDTGFKDSGANDVSNEIAVPQMVDELVYSTALASSTQFGFGIPPQADAPSSGPPGFPDVSRPMLLKYGSQWEIQSNVKYIFMLSIQGRLTAPDATKTMTTGIIYLSNTLGKFCALEVLTGGAVVSWEYNIKGDHQWLQR